MSKAAQTSTAGRAKISAAQLRMLTDIDDGEPTDYADFFLRSGSSALGWRNRERVIAALIARGFIDSDDLKLTDAGRAALSASRTRSTGE